MVVVVDPALVVAGDGLRNSQHPQQDKLVVVLEQSLAVPAVCLESILQIL